MSSQLVPMPQNEEYVDNGVPMPKQEQQEQQVQQVQEVQEEEDEDNDKHFVIQKNPVKQGLKPKKPRSQAQKDAWARALEIRKQNINNKKEKKTKVEPIKKVKKPPKQIEEVIYEEESSEEEEPQVVQHQYTPSYTYNKPTRLKYSDVFRFQ